jgi:hypothetical protein
MLWQIIILIYKINIYFHLSIINFCLYIYKYRILWKKITSTNAEGNSVLNLNTSYSLLSTF